MSYAQFDLRPSRPLYFATDAGEVFGIEIAGRNSATIGAELPTWARSIGGRHDRPAEARLLTLTRSLGDAIVLSTAAGSIKFRIDRLPATKARFSISAPAAVLIAREEILPEARR